MVGKSPAATKLMLLLTGTRLHSQITLFSKNLLIRIYLSDCMEKEICGMRMWLQQSEDFDSLSGSIPAKLLLWAARTVSERTTLFRQVGVFHLLNFVWSFNMSRDFCMRPWTYQSADERKQINRNTGKSLTEPHDVMMSSTQSTQPISGCESGQWPALFTCAQLDITQTVGVKSVSCPGQMTL